MDVRSSNVSPRDVLPHIVAVSWGVSMQPTKTISVPEGACGLLVLSIRPYPDRSFSTLGRTIVPLRSYIIVALLTPSLLLAAAAPPPSPPPPLPGVVSCRATRYASCASTSGIVTRRSQPARFAASTTGRSPRSLRRKKLPRRTLASRYGTFFFGTAPCPLEGEGGLRVCVLPPEPSAVFFTLLFPLCKLRWAGFVYFFVVVCGSYM